MDKATLIGIIAGVALIVTAIVLGSSVGTFFNLPSVLITVGGTVAAVLINFPLHTVIDVFKVVKKAFLHKDEPPTGIIRTIVKFSEISRREGILALEKRILQLDDYFMREGLQMAVDGTEPGLIRNILETELTNLESRHKVGQSVMHAFGTYAPAYGMIGTLIGLIQMLTLMDDPTKIGPGMAVALITTFYGAIMAYLVFLPLEGKLKNRTKDEILKREMIIEGVLSIQAGDNPRIVRGKLMTYIAPKDRKGVPR